MITLRDCTATSSEAEQKLAIEMRYAVFSRPLDHDEVLAELAGEPAVEAVGRRCEA